MTISQPNFENTPKKLVLFDIDGTILLGGPLWKECFLSALHHYFPEFKFPKISFSGKTDIQICREMMAQAQFSAAEIENSMLKVVDLYIEKAHQESLRRTHEVTVLPGVRTLLEALRDHPDVLLGLLTGNVKKGADTKLGCVGLAQYFKVGVYGDDHWDRYQLPPMAVKRVQEHFGLTFSGKDIVIIGDTIHDVNCGKSIGVRSIAVGTGRNILKEDLLAHNPDYFFQDLSSTQDILEAILSDSK